MNKKVKGILKGCQIPGTSTMGYRDIWDMGRASNSKKRWRVVGQNRPST